MSSIQIRNVSPEAHRELKVRAAAAGISLSDYLKGVVEEVASRPLISEVLRRAGDRPGVDYDAIVEAVRSIRDRD